MNEKLQYYLKVQRNQIIEEHGKFFPAIPFFIAWDEEEIKIKFAKSDRLNQVVYQIFQADKLLEEWTHPDYVPEIKPGVYKPIGDLSKPLLITSVVFVKLGIAKDKKYLQELNLEKITPEKSFSVSQKSLVV